MGMITSLTTNEIAALADVEPGIVRDEIERGAFELYGLRPGRSGAPRFDNVGLVYFRCLRLLGIRVGPELREQLLAAVDRAFQEDEMPESVPIGPALALRVGPIAREVLERRRRFDSWRQERVEERADVLAGQPVLKGTRLALRRLARQRGDRQEFREDYPYVTDDDLEFAPIFLSAYPRRGRPRETAPR